MSYWDYEEKRRAYEAERDARSVLLLIIVIVLAVISIIGLCKISAELTIWSYQIMNKLLRKKTGIDYTNVISSNNFRRSVYWFESILVISLLLSLIICSIKTPNLSGYITYFLFYFVVSTIIRLFYLGFIHKINIGSSMLFVSSYYLSHFTVVSLLATAFLFLPILLQKIDPNLQPNSQKYVSSTEDYNFQNIQRIFNRRERGILNTTQPNSSVKKVTITSNHPSYLIIVLKSIEHQNNIYNPTQFSQSRSFGYIIGVQQRDKVVILVQPGAYEVHLVKEAFQNSKTYFYSYKMNQLLIVQKQKANIFNIKENFENYSTPSDIKSISQFISDLVVDGEVSEVGHHTLQYSVQPMKAITLSSRAALFVAYRTAVQGGLEIPAQRLVRVSIRRIGQETDRLDPISCPRDRLDGMTCEQVIDDQEGLAVDLSPEQDQERDEAIRLRQSEKREFRLEPVYKV